MQDAAANPSTFHFLRGALLLVLGVAFIGFVFYRTLKRSDDPERLLFKWALSALLAGWWVWKIAPLADNGGSDAIYALIVTCALSLVFAIIWRHNIAGLIAKPFGALYDGGSREIEPQPYYSKAESQRKKGHYTESVAEIRRQLDKFPNDFTGQMMLAEIQAENLNDLPGAEVTITRLCEQKGHGSKTLSYALNTLADWHLKYELDRDAARVSLDKIVAMFPDTDVSLNAHQRIAHLAPTAKLVAAHDGHRIAVPEAPRNIGLMASSLHLSPVAANPEDVAGELVAHLESHPNDNEARERLAVIYADHYARLDLAEDQLNQLIEQHGQQVKQVMKWLNLLADLQVRHGAGYDAAWLTLGRIVEKFPDHSAADLARNRMDLLKLELKGKEKSQDVKLGSYEQNLGLKNAPAFKIKGVSPHQL